MLPGFVYYESLPECHPMHETHVLIRFPIRQTGFNKPRTLGYIASWYHKTKRCEVFYALKTLYSSNLYIRRPVVKQARKFLYCYLFDEKGQILDMKVVSVFCVGVCVYEVSPGVYRTNKTRSIEEELECAFKELGLVK